MHSGKYTFRRSNIYDSPDFKLIIALREFSGKFYLRNFIKLLGRFKWVVFLDTDQRVGVPAGSYLLKVNDNTKRTTFRKFFLLFLLLTLFFIYPWLWEFENSAWIFKSNSAYKKCDGGNLSIKTSGLLIPLTN